MVIYAELSKEDLGSGGDKPRVIMEVEVAMGCLEVM